MPNFLLFQAGTKQQVAQCRYFLLKYLALYNLKPPAGTTVVVHTNEPIAFESFLTFFPHFQMPEARPGQLTKTGLLHHFLQQRSGAVLYCDAATYPLQPLEPLFADIEKGAVYLHSLHRHAETDLAKPTRRSTAPRDKTATAATAPSPEPIPVWHAAVVGLHDRDNERLSRVQQAEATAENDLALNYTYSTVFSESGKIKSAAKYIYEYSALPEFGQLLEAFFRKNEEESIPNQVKLVHHMDAAAIQQQKEAYQQQPLLKKWLQRLTGRGWHIQQYMAKL